MGQGSSHRTHRFPGIEYECAIEEFCFHNSSFAIHNSIGMLPPLLTALRNKQQSSANDLPQISNLIGYFQSDYVMNYTTLQAENQGNYDTLFERGSRG